MKKYLLFWFIWVSIILWGCGSKQNPEEIIKKTQVNIINQVQNTVFAKKKWEFDANLKVDVSTPIAKWNANLIFTWLTDNYTWLINLLWSWNASYQWLSGSVNFYLTFITTLNKVYFKLNSLKANLPDPTLNAYLAMVKLIENKWFFLPNKYQSANLKYVNFKDEFKKYSLFKVEKVLKDNTFKVEFNKESYAKIIYDVNKQLYSGLDISVNDIKNQLTWFDIEGILSIKSDYLYFEFSWYVENYNQKIPVKLVYLKNKFRLDLPTIDLNLNKNGDSFKWYLLVKTTNVKLDVNWKLNDKEFELSLSYDQNPILAKVYFVYKLYPKVNIKIQLPKNSIPFESVLNNFWWMSPSLWK